LGPPPDRARRLPQQKAGAARTIERDGGLLLPLTSVDNFMQRWLIIQSRFKED
jgi:hypothetical protein